MLKAEIINNDRGIYGGLLYYPEMGTTILFRLLNLLFLFQPLWAASISTASCKNDGRDDSYCSSTLNDDEPSSDNLFPNGLQTSFSLDVSDSRQPIISSVYKREMILDQMSHVLYLSSNFIFMSRLSTSICSLTPLAGTGIIDYEQYFKTIDDSDQSLNSESLLKQQVPFSPSIKKACSKSYGFSELDDSESLLVLEFYSDPDIKSMLKIYLTINALLSSKHDAEELCLSTLSKCMAPLSKCLIRVGKNHSTYFNVPNHPNDIWFLPILYDVYLYTQTFSNTINAHRKLWFNCGVSSKLFTLLRFLIDNDGNFGLDFPIFQLSYLKDRAPVDAVAILVEETVSLINNFFYKNNEPTDGRFPCNFVLIWGALYYKTTREDLIKTYEDKLPKFKKDSITFINELEALILKCLLMKKIIYTSNPTHWPPQPVHPEPSEDRKEDIASTRSINYDLPIYEILPPSKKVSFRHISQKDAILEAERVVEALIVTLTQLSNDISREKIDDLFDVHVRKGKVMSWESFVEYAHTKRDYSQSAAAAASAAGGDLVASNMQFPLQKNRSLWMELVKSAYTYRRNLTFPFVPDYSTSGTEIAEEMQNLSEDDRNDPFYFKKNYLLPTTFIVPEGQEHLMDIPYFVNERQNSKNDGNNQSASKLLTVDDVTTSAIITQTTPSTVLVKNPKGTIDDDEFL